MKFMNFVCFLLLLSSQIFISCLIGEQNDSWATRTLEKMSIEEKIGQLFMIAAYVDPDFAEQEIGNREVIQEIDRYITQYHVGGLAYVGPSESGKQVALTNHYQKISKTPILIAQDLEWGLSMRLKDGMSFPKNITLGAIQDDHLIYEMGKEIGRQAKLIGVHMNLSPVLDVNIEPENIVINVRSFGSSPTLVAEKGIAVIRGLQDVGVIASAKHFPGLGDITVDPHLGLPQNLHEKSRLEAVELYPFEQAIKAGVLSIQTEHLLIPSLNPEPNTPASLSKKVVDGLLKKKMGFNGLILSGALRMKALTKDFTQEEIVLKAFLAGSDMLLMPQDFPKAYRTLKSAIEDGKISEDEVNERVLKILQMKEWAKLDCQVPLPAPTMDELQSSFAKGLKKQLFKNAVSVVRDYHHLTPLPSTKKSSIAFIQLGDSPSSEFQEILSSQPSVECFFFPLGKDNRQKEKELLDQLNRFSLVILAVFPADPRRIAEIRLLNEKKQTEELKHFRVHGIPESCLPLVNALKDYKEKTIVAYFGNPFGFHFFDNFSTMVMAYESDPIAQQAVATIILGNE